jgi:integrase
MTSRYQIAQLARVRRAHVAAFRDELVARQFSPKTIHKKLGVVKTIFGCAVESDLMAASPATQVKVASGDAAVRGPFTVDELRTIFASDVYVDGARPSGCGEHAVAWVPLIAAFTGMRVEEICQLHVSDVMRDEKHGWYFNINSLGGKTLKTESSRRNVPIHRELLELGILGVIEAAQSANEMHLFWDLAPDKYGRRSSRFSKKWNRHMRSVLKLGEDDRTRSFHSFRHLFKEHCRSCGIGEDANDALTGHRQGPSASAGRGYGGAFPLGRLFLAMKRFRIEGLRLDHLQGRLPLARTEDATRAEKAKPRACRSNHSNRARRPSR